MPLTSFATNIRGIASRVLPQTSGDNTESTSRFGRYGENTVLSYVRKQHLLADEGSYFVVNNGQAGILSSAATGWAATTPAAIIFNGDSAGGKRVYLDYLALITTVVGSAASGLVNLQGAVYLDSGNRFSSGGTNLTSSIVSPNMDSSAKSVSTIYFGAITATAATAAVRAVAGLRIIRPAVSATVLDVVGEQKILNFGGVESAMNGSITVANANNIPVPMPPIVIGPQQSCLIYLWQNVGATNVAATYAPELAFWER